MAEAVRHYQRVPTQPELRHFRRDNPSLPDDSTIRRSFPSKDDWVAALRGCCESELEHADLLAFLPDAKGPTESVGLDQSSDLQKGWVYLAVMPMGRERRFKIGKATAVNRRMGQINLETPEDVELIHQIEMDDANGIEAYWHKRFADKRSNGEWFRLSDADVRAFKRRKFQ